MNVRSVIISTPPLYSTHAGFSRVSVLCEPWNKPDTPAPRPQNQSVVSARLHEDAADKITRALRQGESKFDAILNTAFGKRHGGTDDLGRRVLNKLLAEGRVTRERSNDPGKPFIWRLKND